MEKCKSVAGSQIVLFALLLQILSGANRVHASSSFSSENEISSRDEPERQVRLLRHQGDDHKATSSSSSRHPQPHRPIPRDLYIDRSTGQGYIKVSGTSSLKNTNASDTLSSLPLDNGQMDDIVFAFELYGRGSSTQREQDGDHAHRNLKKGKSVKNDSIKPTVSKVYPPNNAVLSTNTFQVRATVTDNIKVSTVSVALVNTATGYRSVFSLSKSATGSNVWTKTIQARPGVTLKMTLTATDSSQNTVTTAAITFKTGKSSGDDSAGGSSVNGSSSSGGGGTTISSTPTNRNPVSKAQWTDRTAPLSRASGRLLFQMADSKGNMLTYVCSGTLVQLPPSRSGGMVDRSVVMTAAHCVYDDDNKQFARNVLFIPQQDDGGMDMSDRDCTNDALGCLSMDFGFVSNQYASRIFPNNIGADYGFYVSKSTKTSVKGKSIGGTSSSDIVPMLVNFGPITSGGWTYAMGYSYADDPDFMYSVGPIGKDNDGLVPNHSLKSCTLTRGSSGGPWTQDTSPTVLSDGIVRIMGVNSWGYVGEPGMASSPLNTGGAACVYDAAVSANLATMSGLGRVVNCNV